MTKTKKPITIAQILRLRTVSDPQPSPDGDAVVYAVNELRTKGKQYQSNLWLVSVAGGPARQMTSSGNAREPRWSPKGEQLAFVARRGREKARQIWVLPVDGGEAKPLTDVATGVHGIDWAPDGRSLMFLSREPMGPQEQALEKRGGIRVVDQFVRMTQVWRVDVETGLCRQLTRDRSTKTVACWSPDGEHIAFEQRQDPTSNQTYRAGLWLMDAQGRNKRRLSDRTCSATSPQWAPDGARILFLRRDLSSYVGLTRLAVVAIDNDSPAQVLTQNLDRGVIEARWST
ncbi:MAG TPA: hypothetical protein EYQ31_07605, partial [Candidatus Handelsmanbacteria bacterium]|nr:hypothetical protein [Candidatus Handelsmanbacteria bacterium]